MGDGLLTPLQFAVLWFSVTLLMWVHTIGWMAGWWGATTLLYWGALGGLIALSAVEIANYYVNQRG